MHNPSVRCQSSLASLSCDASGVLPPIARLTPKQSVYHFISGYMSTVTETGIGLVPRAEDHLGGGPPSVGPGGPAFIETAYSIVPLGFPLPWKTRSGSTSRRSAAAADVAAAAR
ncbi:MAG: phosphoenolpyruvate carboxykinase (ATP) [Candidatus Krumholzibacteriia bacterium]